MTRAYDHCAFGLTIRARRRLPGLGSRPSSGDADVVVEFPARPPSASPRRVLWYESPPDRYRQRLRVWRESGKGDFEFAYDDGTCFRLRADASAILAWWPAELSLADATMYLLGPVMGLVLRLRGQVCLHASVVGVEGEAVGIMAPAGHGKSTTAATFALRGHPVLSDDILVVAERDGRFLVQSGCPRLRLWPQAVEALFGSPDALPRISPGHPEWDKRYLDLAAEDYAFEDRALPLRALYTGTRDDDAASPRLHRLRGGEALLTTLASGYVSHLLDDRMRAREFELVGRLVERVPVVRFGIRAGIERLEGLRRAIVADCRERGASRSRRLDEPTGRAAAAGEPVRGPAAGDR